MISPPWLSSSPLPGFAAATGTGWSHQLTLTTEFVVLAVFVVVCALLLRARRLKVKIAGPLQCTLYQMPVVFDRLREQGQDGSFAVFTFQPPGTSNRDDAIDIQFSIEDGRIGLDWYVLGPANIRDKEKVERFITAQGYQVRWLEMNQKKYLRVDQGDLTRLCQNVITRLYALRTDAKLDLVVEGFPWP